jgi:hypothetical protein
VGEDPVQAFLPVVTVEVESRAGRSRLESRRIDANRHPISGTETESNQPVTGNGGW